MYFSREASIILTSLLEDLAHGADLSPRPHQLSRHQGEARLLEAGSVDRIWLSERVGRIDTQS